MQNVPNVKIGLIAVSRDCFPAELSARRRAALYESAKEKGLDITICDPIVENERDMLNALETAKANGVNALVVYLGNFGPETSETLFAKYFDGPVMYLAAAEGDGDLIQGRGDAYCGLLNCSYNLDIRNLRAIIPENPVGLPHELADTILEYVDVLRAIIALKNLKIITFGPRPQDFLACNAPIKPLFDLGIEIQENSELDLLAAYKAYDNAEAIQNLMQEMAAELNVEITESNQSVLERSARLQLTLEDWAEKNRGSREYVVFANKCWPAFQSQFGCCPCYANSRLAAKGMPVGCEVDIYGALSQYIGTVLTNESCTLLDINNTVPDSIYQKEIQNQYPYTQNDLFMGFHCGNTPVERLQKGAEVKYHVIMRRTLEPTGEPNITRGTLDGNLIGADTTIFRLQSTADCKLQAYIAQGEIIPLDCQSFGGIGVIAIPQMARFYRHVLIEKHFPHHSAVAFSHIGRKMHQVLRYFGVKDISFNRPQELPYETECPL